MVTNFCRPQGNREGNKIRFSLARFIIFLFILLAAGCFVINGQAQPPPKPGQAVNHGKIKPQAGKSEVSGKVAEVHQKVKEIAHPVYAYVNKQTSRLLGTWVNQPIWNKITWFSLFFFLFLLIFVFLFERLLHALNRRFLPKVPSPRDALPWLEILAWSLIAPLSLLIWIFGTYGALYPILIHFPAADNVILRIAGVAGIFTVIWFIYRLIGILDLRLQDVAAARQTTLDSLLASLFRAGRQPLRLLFGIILVRLSFPLMAGPRELFVILDYACTLASIASVAWLIIAATNIPVELVTSHYDIEAKDNLEARKIHTQIRFFARLVKITVVVVALAFMLMIFPAVRHVGISILASAGVMGIIAGLAAQRSIANILVGIQIAVTQPFRVEDVVVVEGEWGWIEEITATYVVVRIWDLRRLVLPIIYFTEKPFQNWTRTSADLLGTVFLYVDYTVPIEAIRQELHRILQASSYWDKKAWGLQVTDTSERTVTLRALMSAADSPSAWNLRCEVREKLVTYLQEHYPAALPKIRGELTQPDLAEGKEIPGKEQIDE
jgi:small-conductance mechanosensitive channel